jgi:TrmH family RNA methyltransferase
MSKIETLTSPANPLLKEIRRAIARGTPTRDGFCIAESFHLVAEAVQSGCEIQAVVVAESAYRPSAALHGLRVIVLKDTLFAGLSSTETTQGILALVRPPAWEIGQLFGKHPLVVVLDGIQDPGNAGAILRAAEAFGATGVVFLKGTVSPHNPKAVRASAGSVFRVPLVAGLDDGAALTAIERHRVDLYAAMAEGEVSVAEADLARNCAFVIGSEGRGVSERLRTGAAGLRIPVSGVESLNAAMAAGILLYEARRQRSATP